MKKYAVDIDIPLNEDIIHFIFLLSVPLLGSLPRQAANGDER